MSAATLWVLVNLLHASACVVWATLWRRHRPGTSIDETFFVGAILWLGSLSCVLHALAAAGLLSLPRAALGLLTIDALLWRARGRSTGSTPTRSSSETPWLDWAGAAVLAALSAQWLAGDVSQGSIGGVDAAHYHVPHAVNFALGSGLFDPPATGHLYPMGASVVASWFILPVGNGLLVDSASLPWFILLAASLCWLFRQSTDSSGLAVVPWFLLLLLLLPIVRISAPFSADLPFASSFIALLATVLSFAREELTVTRMVTCALLTGLLLGTKATGLPAAVLLALCATAPLVIAHRRQALTWPWSSRRAIGVTLACGVLVVAAGGIWQIVNWRNYGSPIAPLGVQIGGITVFAGPDDYLRGYMSVSRDVRQDGADRTWRFARRYIHDWTGPLLLLLQWFVPLTCLDAAVALKRRRAPEAALVRVMLVTGGVLITVVFCWLLYDAPWTSLRWTSGLSLRYLLPLIVLGAFVTLLAAFPLTAPWYRGRYRYAGVLILAVTAIAGTLAWDRPPEQDPGHHLLILSAGPVAAAIVAIAGLAAAAIWRLSVNLAVAATSVLIVVAAISGGRSIDTQSRALTSQAVARLSAAGTATSAEAASALISGDAARRQDGSLRRIFVAARLDTPLDLQAPVYDALVYDTHDPAVVQRLLRGAEPGTGASDYLIGSIAELQTTRGSPMVAYCGQIATLVALGDAGPYRVWRVSPPSGPTSSH